MSSQEVDSCQVKKSSQSRLTGHRIAVCKESRHVKLSHIKLSQVRLTSEAVVHEVWDGAGVGAINEPHLR
jgi:hypothetical protein